MNYENSTGRGVVAAEDEFTGSLTEQELLEIRQELGLIEYDETDIPSSSIQHTVYINGSENELEEDTSATAFDSPLTEAERKLLDQFALRTTSTYCPSPNMASRSASLAEVADNLIKDLENYDLDINRSDEHSNNNWSDSDASTLSVDLPICQHNSMVHGGQHAAFGSTPDPHSDQRNSSALDVDFSATSASSSSVGSGSLSASLCSELPATDSSALHHRYFVVVAIDFGTTFSGYAFAFTRDPESIHMMRRWEGGDPGVSNQKTPTTLLLRPDRTFHSFGFGARDFYHDLEPDEARKWLFFEKFKMALHTLKNLNKSVEIKAANGKTVKAVSVFAHALRFFKEHVIEEITDQSATQIVEDDIQWVITVPAIWSATAKQFMRIAAYEAGLAAASEPDRILIALEPEAASICCRKLRMRDCKWDDSQRRSTLSSKTDFKVADEFQDKTRYMVVDCGGGTVDLTVHELDTKAGTLQELHKGTGGACGATGVDEEFEALLKKILGKEFIEQFKTKRPAGWVDLMIAFETKKRTANPSKANPLNISLPFVLIDYYKKHKGSSIEAAIKKFGSSQIKWSSQGMLRIAPETMKTLFSPVLKKIVQHIRVLLSTKTVSHIEYLFLVGGFAESPLLQAAIREAFGSQMRIIIPQDVGLTILKGAVLFGLDPTVITVRRAAMTYGVGVLNRYVVGKHPRAKLVKKNGIEWCTDVFDAFVVADQAVHLKDKVTRSYAPAKPGQNYTSITIYSSEQEHVKFVTDLGVRKCGQIQIEMAEVQSSKPSQPREIQASMEFGDTEIRVNAVDVMTGHETRATIDFLTN